MNLELTVETLLMDESFIDFCLNEHSPHRNKWQAIAAADPANKLVMDEALNWLHALHPSLRQEEILQEIEKVKASIQTPAPVAIAQKEVNASVTVRGMIVRFRWQWAAAVLLLVSLPMAYYFLQKPAKTELNFDTPFAQSGMGERKQVSLPDGSTVVLKSNSSISLDKGYNKTQRNIRLEGQAYFEVFHDPSRPLTVHNGNFATTALGTAFFIDGNSPDTAFTVQLLEGKISVQSPIESREVLKPGYRLNWAKDADSFSLETFDKQPLEKWISGNLEFDRNTVSDVLHQLGIWYGVPIVDKRAKKGQIKITGNYSNQPLTDILQALCFTLNCKFREEKNFIVIE
ncbi:MAG: FecR family protein [Chitinophagaceae bacterium]